MGVVFRALDTQLQRQVALKLLQDHLGSDADRLARFQREAQVLASLNHPNIAQIYGLERSGGTDCIVMELVEGETLADRLKRGAMAVGEAIPVAMQIVDALEAAHERGIVHRDLKPSNIVIMPQGTVKLLDFGLAKAFGPESSAANASQSPTLVSGSGAGVIMGTAAYMSPEQARGKPIDARTDVWAFGCVLYEMLTSRQAFHGETVTDILAKIIEGQPNWSLLAPDTPHSIRILLTVTLKKNPRQRLQHIGDSRLFLDQTVQEYLKPAAVSKASMRRRWIMTALLGLALVASLVPAGLYFLRSPETTEDLRFEMPTPEIIGSSLTISPNGEHIAYVAVQEGNRAIWMQPLGAVNAEPVQGTENAIGFSWSPDSRYIAFFADQKLRKINLAEGSLTTLGDSDTTAPGAWPAWNASGDILYARLQGVSAYPAIVRISELGGEPILVAEQKQSEPFGILVQPQFLPDGRHFLFRRLVQGTNARASVMVGSLDSKTTTEVTSVQGFSSIVRYAAPGFLLFIQNGVLTAQRFDLGSFKLTGDPVPLVEQVGNNFAVADNGRLVYQHAQQGTPVRSATNQLQWFDRNGKPQELLGAPSTYGSIELSPDGSRVAVDQVTAVAANRDIYTVEIDRGASDRLTTDEAPDVMPVWEPPGGKGRVLFASQRGDSPIGNPKLFIRSSSSVGGDTLLFEGLPSEGSLPQDWSADGRHIVFIRRIGANASSWNLWIRPMFGDEKPVAYLETPFRKTQAQISPNGKWLAYVTNETGTNQVVVQTFPNQEGGRWPVTANGGVSPRWGADGRELYYVASDGKLMAVQIKEEPVFTLGPTTPLFQTTLPTRATALPQLSGWPYDVDPKGQRFLLITPYSASAANSANPADPVPITVIVDWRTALRKER